MPHISGACCLRLSEHGSLVRILHTELIISDVILECVVRDSRRSSSSSSSLDCTHKITNILHSAVRLSHTLSHISSFDTLYGVEL